jgi:uncharacterized protein
MPSTIRSVALFVGLSFGLAWAVMLPTWLRGGDLAAPSAYVAMIAMMFTPTIAALVVVRLVERRPWRTLWLDLGLGRVDRRTVRRSLGGLAVGAGVVLGGWVFAVVFGVLRPDPDRSQAADLLHEAFDGSLPAPVWVLALAQLASLPIGIAITAIAALGEEIGWRGYLLPSLTRFGVRRALVVSGVAWGCWHAPVILLGYNFGQPNALGLGMMIVACALVGVLFGMLRLRSGSIWPSVLAHATLNSLATYQAFLVPAHYDMVLIGPLSVTGWCAALVLIGVMLLRRRADGVRRTGGAVGRAE